MSLVAERARAVVAELASVDREMRMEMLVDWSDRFREVPPEVAVRPFPADHQVPWCQSEAYVWAVPDEAGALAFHFGVDNPQGLSAMALAAILSEVTAGVRPEEVLEIPDDLAYALFGAELSMGKGQGLTAMVGMVKALARARLAAGRPAPQEGVSR
jgi:cysteine desulfuration protein SufE